MEKFLKQILNKLDSLDADVKELKQLKPKIEESHLWLEALYTADRFHKADIDRLEHKIATVEGVLNSVANSLEPIKKTQ